MISAGVGECAIPTDPAAILVNAGEPLRVPVETLSKQLLYPEGARLISVKLKKRGLGDTVVLRGGLLEYNCL